MADIRRITGRVLDEHGQGIQGAQFELYWTALNPGPRLWTAHDTRSFGPIPGVESGADGSFELSALEKPRPDDDLTLCLLLRHPTHLNAYRTWIDRLVDAHGIARVEMVLAQGRTLRGRVIGEDDQPISGIEVWADPPHWAGLPILRRGARSDPSGSFEITGLPPMAAQVKLADPFTPALETSVDLSQGDVNTLELRLPRSWLEGPPIPPGKPPPAWRDPTPSTLEVQLVNAEDGQPLHLPATRPQQQSLWRRLLARRAPPPPPHAWIETFEGNNMRDDPVDNQGHARIELRRPNKVRLRAMVPGWHMETSDLEPSADGPSATLSIPMHRAPPLQGRITDAQGRSIAGAQVRALPAEETRLSAVRLSGMIPSWQTSTARDGTFHFPGLDPSTTLWIEHPDHPIHLIPATANPKTHNLTVTLAPGATFKGRITYQDGSPAAGQLVTVQATKTSDCPPHLWNLALPSTTTQDDGHYRLDRVPAGTWILRAGFETIPLVATANQTIHQDRVIARDRRIAADPG